LASTINETERAWAAGFYDGEGCTSLATYKKRRTKTRIRMNVTQAGPDGQPPASLIRFHAAVGGVGSISKRAPRPRIRQQWEWRAQKFDDVRAAFEALRPYLDLVKVDQYADCYAMHVEERGVMKDMSTSRNYFSPRSCSITGCHRRHREHGFCGAHYQRWVKHGDPLAHIPIREVLA
jgi:hypothetical protein